MLVVLGNVLDFRTYWTPTQEENQKANKNQQILIDHDFNTISISEQFAICYSQSIALYLNWIWCFSIITSSGGGNVQDLPSSFFIQDRLRMLSRFILISLLCGPNVICYLQIHSHLQTKIYLLLCCLSLGICLAPISHFLPHPHLLILFVPWITLCFHLLQIPWSPCDLPALPLPHILLPTLFFLQFSDHLLTHPASLLSHVLLLIFYLLAYSLSYSSLYASPSPYVLLTNTDPP